MKVCWIVAFIGGMIHNILSWCQLIDNAPPPSPPWIIHNITPSAWFSCNMSHYPYHKNTHIFWTFYVNCILSPMKSKRNSKYTHFERGCRWICGKIPWNIPDLYACLFQAMEELVELGLVRSLGVSNFNIKQLSRLLQHCTIRPAVHQVSELKLRRLERFCLPQNSHYCRNMESGINTNFRTPDTFVG